MHHSHVRIYIYTCMYAHIQTYQYRYRSFNIHVHLHVHLHIHIHIYMCTYVHVHIHICSHRSPILISRGDAVHPRPWAFLRQYLKLGAVAKIDVSYDWWLFMACLFAQWCTCTSCVCYSLVSPWPEKNELSRFGEALPRAAQHSPNTASKRPSIATKKRHTSHKLQNIVLMRRREASHCPKRPSRPSMLLDGAQDGGCEAKSNCTAFPHFCYM